MSFSKKITDLKREVLKESEPLFAHIEDVAEANTLKVLDAMRECRVSDAHFNTTTGYAYDDIGRGKLEELYAKIFGAERALVRTQFVSGTHALATVLFGILRPGDELVSLTGKPYDTMQTVIGYDNPSPGSLKEFGVLYNELPMVAGKVDMAHIKDVITDKTKMVEIQRSRGYSMRSPLSIEDIRAITTEVHRIKPDCICFVDNCYGEFVDYEEPTQAGADIMAGSLIKNPGGGIAPTGGYIVGRDDLVELASYRLTAPGMGDELGASLSNNRLLFQGLFLAPHVVSQAIKGRDLRSGHVRQARLQDAATANGRARRHHPGHRARQRRQAHRLLRRHPEVFACRFLRRAGAVGHAGLRRQDHHGGRHLRAGRFHRVQCRRPAARTLQRLPAGWPDLRARHHRHHGRRTGRP